MSKRKFRDILYWLLVGAVGEMFQERGGYAALIQGGSMPLMLTEHT